MMRALALGLALVVAAPAAITVAAPTADLALAAFYLEQVTE